MTDRVCVAYHSREIDTRVSCPRRAVVEFGSVALCEEHLDVLESGRELKAAYCALAHVRRWLTEPKGNATPLLVPELE
jgi:hypothetical protein